MSKSVVYQGQNFVDKVLETTGSTENAFEMSILNKVSLTDNVAIGQELQVSKVTRKGVVGVFNQKRPASAIISISETDEENEGIGYMAIGNNFIVR